MQGSRITSTRQMHANAADEFYGDKATRRAARKTNQIKEGKDRGYSGGGEVKRHSKRQRSKPLPLCN